LSLPVWGKSDALLSKGLLAGQNTMVIVLLARIKTKEKNNVF